MGQYQEEIKQGTETTKPEPTNLIAQKGKSKAEEADSEKAEASAKEENITAQTQRENERVEGRIERKDAPAATASRAISPGRGAEQPGGEATTVSATGGAEQIPEIGEKSSGKESRGKDMNKT